MLDLLLLVIPLAFAAAISPVVLMAALAVLDGPKPVPQSLAFAIGVVATIGVLFGLGLIAILVIRDGDEPHWFASDHAHVAVGAMLIVAGVALGLVRPNPQRGEEFRQRYLLGTRPLYEFAIAGVALMITNVSTFVVLIAILHDVARAHATIGEEVVALLVVTLIASLPATGPLVAAIVGGQRLRADLSRASRLTMRYGRYIMAALWIAFGVKDVLEVVLG